ncbi:WD40 repeat and LisH dimerisation motif domain and CTLH, C-terminal LisH motif domain and WD40/YVTN repeat-like-containing domain and WD40-repeat-containing domain-containing protein [Strongyloides ratti]|uniref:WD40 repeat and LisH dimerisation motif domain and CTLH, C-terminal LisH motif domain and WD40/YVTN repeat-like-containing domain and WD40-repeat-containing domain-containing protein n=1 Tax=Strongyloides ratti TaxID=34506 RepID=A0A090MYX2_STRRB|nr:WD40 repeat and LisH dimerisation motif domain and CTLH, C-terminal LisH motif domain and WD40/YVTN repeat-like-containing domain and WD40-repeat-containing domain-containing protein [Strongyloides ratti]CEF67929.1 WD40 repeat and LisH dimerisation motif domain and CTLH, C-terminal LisH motif domain and WD40/YVTN repeat-like-containing domain and WD40-repeat-containing domain-containing protein [Strongyloides ratti]
MTTSNTNSLILPLVNITIKERDVLKAILEFFETNGYHIAQLSLERETGIINGDYSDDIIFLRQLILDGQWDNALDFIDPLKELDEFDFRTFRYLITKYKYFELLCIKQEPGPMYDNEFTVEEIVECLKDLEHISPTLEDYRHLCALLTLPKLSDHTDFKNWNPSSARVECFSKILPLVEALLPKSISSSSSKKNDHREEVAINGRLLQLIVKGCFYENCVDYCQSQALGDIKQIDFSKISSKVLQPKPSLCGADLSLISWLEVVSNEQFVMPFQQMSIDFKVDTIKRSKLDAQWTEQILATPIKPKGNFPYNMIPNDKLKCAQKMSQSMMSLPHMFSSCSLNQVLSSSKRSLQHMSQSTAPGFSIDIKDNENRGEELMRQSQIIDNMLEKSELSKTTRPNPGSSSASSHSMSSSPSLIPPNSLTFDCSSARKELDEITRRYNNNLNTRSTIPLPPVPELSTPGGTFMNGEDLSQNNLLMKSQIIQQFANRTYKEQIIPPNPLLQSMIMNPINQMNCNNLYIPQQQMPPIQNQFYPPINYSQSHQLQQYNNQKMLVDERGIGGQMIQQSPMYTIQKTINNDNLSNVQSQNSIHFIPVCKYEDSQAIRAVAFHPSGKFFAIGTNSKQLHICRYPDVRSNLNNRKISRSYLPQPEIVLSRPKQHRGSVYCTSFNQTGELLATGSNDKTIHLMSFQANTATIVAETELTMLDGTIRDIIFMEDSMNNTSIMVSGGAGSCQISLTDCLYSWDNSCSFVSCSQDKTIKFWDVRANGPVQVITQNFKNINSPVTSVCVDPNGKLLVSGHEDASVMLYDITGNRVVQVYRPHGDEIRSVRFSNAAYYLLSGSYDKRISITDMRGDLTSPLTYLPVAEHTDKVIQCRWHPHDFTFLSTSADRSAILWSLPLNNVVNEY